MFSDGRLQSHPRCPQPKQKPCDTDKEDIVCNGDVQMSDVPRIVMRGASSVDLKENALNKVRRER